MKFFKQLAYYLKILPIWIKLTAHNTWGIFNVFFIVWCRPMKGGVVDGSHPFATGINPETGDYIWTENVVFASKRKREFKATDKEILETTGKHMAEMFKKVDSL